MAEESTQEKKEKPSISKQISAALAHDGKFTYYPGMSYELHKDSRPTSKYEFQEQLYRYTNNAERIEHAFVIAAVLKLGSATKKMILDYLLWQKRCFPQKSVPLCNGDEVARQRSLTAILKKLAKNGLVVAHDYVAAERDGKKSVIIIYTGTMYGHTLYRNVLDEYMEFDMNSVFRTDLTSLRMLATNAVLFRFAEHPHTTGIYVNGRYGLEKPYKKLKNHVFGLATMENDGRKQLFIAEPVFFRYNSEIKTEEHLMEYVEDRFDKLAKIAEQAKELSGEDVTVRILYIVENMDGLSKIRKIIGEDEQADIFRDALYTSENVVYEQGGDLNRSFLKLQYMESSGKLQFKPATAGWCICPD